METSQFSVAKEGKVSPINKECDGNTFLCFLGYTACLLSPKGKKYPRTVLFGVLEKVEEKNQTIARQQAHFRCHFLP